MENCLYHHTISVLPPTSSSCSSSLSSSLKPQLTHNLSPKSLRFFPKSSRKPFDASFYHCRRRRLQIMAGGAGAGHCQFSSLNSNSPMPLKSPAGQFLSGVLQNYRQLFHTTVKEELILLSDDRDAAVARMTLNEASDEAVLHRRIAQLTEDQCQTALQDIMYLLISYKFSEIRVPLVPKLSKCMYNGRLEILPSKNWELESIHNLGVLDLLREHITAVTGLRANSSVTESWATTKIRHFSLAQIYVASILYGYFLKSVSLRYHLERSLSLGDHCRDHRTAPSVHNMCHYGYKDVIFGRRSNLQSVGQGLIGEEEKSEDFKCYVMGFHPGSLQRCAKLRSVEAVKLVESYSCALFGNEKCELVESDDVILTSFSSLKRLVMEAAAFGSFLWEAEDYIDNVYKLKDI